MKRWNRALTTLLAAAAAGFLLWYVPHFDRWTTGGYWGLIGVVALAGILVGLAQLHSREGNPTATFLLSFLPVLVAVGWVVLAAQPQGNWFRDHTLSWSGDLGIRHAVHNLGEHVAVLAFALGLIFGLTFEPAMIPRRRKVAPPVAPAAPVVNLHAADEPEPIVAGPDETAVPEQEQERPTPPTDTIGPR